MAAALGANGSSSAEAQASPTLRPQYAQPVSLLSGLPPASGQGSARGAAGLQNASVNLHHEIAKDIGQQVEMMILQAKRNSETKVGAEVQKIKAKIVALEEKLKLVESKMDAIEPRNGPILKADLQKSIAKLEEVWEGEVGTLKHELWQTIQAHNHNADLMKHHKDAIDLIQARMTENASLPSPEQENMQSALAQLKKFEQKEEAQQARMEQLMKRASEVQQMWTWGGFGASALPGLPPPHLSAMLGVGLPGAGPGAGAAGAGMTAGKKAKAKGKSKAAAKAPVSSANLAPTLRAEAPEFVPGGGDL